MIAARDNETPSKQAMRAGKGGVVPPPEHRFKPGESGNPNGRPRNAGWTIHDWMNQMQDWSVADLERLLKDKKAPVAKRAAARCWIDAATREYTSSGTPVGGTDLDRICDRTDGKVPDRVANMPGESLVVKVIKGVSMDDL